MAAHTRFGRIAGLSDEQITDLIRLDPDRFDARTHAALTYVRAFLTEPEGVPPEIVEQFEMLWPLPGRNHVLAAMKGMFISNLTANTCRLTLESITGRRTDAEPGAACAPPTALTE